MKSAKILFLTLIASVYAFSQISQVQEAAFAFDQKDFSSVQTTAKKKSPRKSEEDGNFPDNLLAHRCFSFEDKRDFPAFEKGARYFSPAYSFICFIPTADDTEQNFAKSYPDFSAAISKLDKLLESRATNFKQFDDLFDVPYNNSGWSFESKIQYLDYRNVSGVFFLTQYTQELFPNLANNEELTANFQGLTNDKKYYVAARFGATHPSLPKGIDFTDERVRDEAFSNASSGKDRIKQINENVRHYLKTEGEKVEKLPEDSFKPALTSLKNIIASISVK